MVAGASGRRLSQVSNFVKRPPLIDGRPNFLVGCAFKVNVEQQSV